jgi:hypothetical protein
MPVPTTLSVGARTPIDGASYVSFVNSPINIDFYNSTFSSLIKRVTVYLWIWQGAQNKTLGAPNHILKKDKVSASDKKITLEISDQIRAVLNPIFIYNELTPPAIAGQATFYQIQAEIETTGSATIENIIYNTHLATLGKRWDYEQTRFASNNGVARYGSFGFQMPVNLKFNPRIHDYQTQDFDFTKSVATATTDNLIIKTPIVPTDAQEQCTRDSTLIVYLDKRGLFEMFTPHGKVVIDTKIESQITNKSYRSPNSVDNWFNPSKVKNSIDAIQTFTINTGNLLEGDGQVIEEILLSPLVYLIRFKGDVNPSTTVGITIDNTFVTIDSDEITIDSVTVTDEKIGQFSIHQQIPVVVTDSAFLRKTRMNDKVEINYTIKMETTTNKILDIK